MRPSLGGGGGPTLDGLIIKHLDLIEENLVSRLLEHLEDEESLFTLRTSWRTRSPSLLSEPPGGRGVSLYSPNLLEDEESLFTLRTSWRTRNPSLLSEPPGGRGVSLYSPNLLEDEESLFTLRTSWRTVCIQSGSYMNALQLKHLHDQILLEQQEVTWQPQDHPPRQEVPPPPQEVPPPLPPPPCFQELESSATMKASTFNYARPKQFIASNLSSPRSSPLSPSVSHSPPPLSPPSSNLSSPSMGLPLSSFPPPPPAFFTPPRTSLPPLLLPSSSSPPHLPVLHLAFLPLHPHLPLLNAMGLPRGNSTIKAFPRKSSVTRTPRQSSDSDIQGSKDAVIQDLERKLRFKEERKLTYEEKMARRLLGADNAATVLQSGESEEEASTTQEYKVSSFEQRLISEIEFRLERSPVEESDEDVQHDEDSVGGAAPSFLQKIKHYKVFEGMPVTFSCKVTGDPKPKVYWFKDGKQISKRSEHYRISRGSDGTSSLHTANASLDDDGNYTIMAGNPQVSKNNTEENLCT
ncbi:Palladin [Dissostichus eleginoides]|uniref:Palladin n=1 Tax=Dissostichus eleginoides TaxID=100907 RepID=A0AAD9B1H1_DISEL|nr:Palladin [Dissostichus eleginoides]